MLKKILLALLILVCLAGLIPFLVPVPPLEGTLPVEDLAGPQSSFQEIEGLKVHLLQSGSGQPALILLHGFGASAFSWREVTGPLSASREVIAYDRPAFGLTERPLVWDDGQNPYTPEAQVRILIGLLDAYQIERAVLIGNSAGGTVAIKAALAYPDRVAALVLVDAAVYQGGGSPAWIRPLLHTPQLDHLGPLLVRRIASQGNDFIERAWHDPSLITPEIYAGYRLPLQAENWDRALWEFTRSSADPDLESSLSRLRMPVLVLSGDDDRIVPTDLSRRLASDIPGSELVIFENCGHLPQEECPADFLAAVSEFLDSLPD